MGPGSQGSDDPLMRGVMSAAEGGEGQQQQYSFREDDSESMQDTHVYKQLDSSLADRLLKEA